MPHKLTLLGQLQAVFNAALIREQANHGAAEEAWRREKTALQADLDRATLADKHTAKRILHLAPDRTFQSLTPGSLPPFPSCCGFACTSQ